MPLADYHVPDFAPVAAEAAVVTADDLRITVLTSRLLRIEYAPDGGFEDRPSQTVWDRDQPVPDFTVREEDHVHVETDHLHLRYDPGRGVESLRVSLTEFGTTWTYGDEDATLGGTARTLDGVDGATDLDPGLLARDGWTVLDDTDALVFDDGWVTPRDADEGYEDLYFFGYGHDYLDCLADFQSIAGDTPMLPRWALGNWWSRYWEYSQSDLRALIERFEAEDLPLSVCVIDMDWHVVDNPHHDGWTGWTWNEEYFPDPEGFVDWLHDAGLKTTLNLHPAEGVHPHEAQYEAIAEHVGIDPASERPVEFDASDPTFLRGYFDHVIDPMEETEGIDFWWIDWQQWEESPEMEGLDPLWALNHLHALDRTRDGRRPFILSRWAAPGNHRYPVGFSGDTVVSWESLAFQPYMTATGGNVGCNWWSHDIGGHYGGTGDSDVFAEQYVRWTQFGALSPINRIHTSKLPFVDKRPWQFDDETFGRLGDALRRRHALIPYVYTMARRTHDRGVPLCRPLYYHHPETDAAYHHPQEYYFGSELLAAPHVRPREDSTNLARRAVWLPEGTWFDVDSGRRYDGGTHVRYGDLEDVPLYAKAGAIVPQDAEPAFGETDTPDRLELLLFPGATSEFELYEDDGTSRAYREGASARTPIAQHWEGDWLSVEIGPATGRTELLPDSRDIELRIRGVAGDADVTVEGARGHVDAYDDGTNTLSITLSAVAPEDDVTVYLDTDGATLLGGGDHTRERVETLLGHFEMPAGAKPQLLDRAQAYLAGEREGLGWLAEFAPVTTTPQLRAVAETLTDAGFEHVRHADTERLHLFNDGAESVTYQFATFDQWGVIMDRSGDADRGRLPSSRTIELDDLETHDWELTVNYDDVFQVRDSGAGHDPTQE